MTRPHNSVIPYPNVFDQGLGFGEILASQANRGHDPPMQSGGTFSLDGLPHCLTCSVLPLYSLSNLFSSAPIRHFISQV
jgi:hypothetical protein